MKITSVSAFPATPRTLLVAVGAAIALLLAACGGEAATPPITVSTATPAAPPTTAAQPSARPASTSAPAQSCSAFVAAQDPFLMRVVDKQRGLPADYRPGDLQTLDDRWAVPGFPGATLRAPAAGPLVEMLAAADAQGVEVRVRSSFRSYAEQQRTFQFWVDQLGEAQARRESAPPGNSEHQLGTTADIISRKVGTGWELIPAFGETVEGKWVAAHAHEFGFAISYPPDGETITGYIYEPWHVRYIGKPCAAEWRASGLVLVQFLERLAAAR